MFNKKYILKWSMFHCYVRLPECNQKPMLYLWLGIWAFRQSCTAGFCSWKKWDIGIWLSRSFALGSNQSMSFLSFNWGSYNSTPKRCCELPWWDPGPVNRKVVSVASLLANVVGPRRRRSCRFQPPQRCCQMLRMDCETWNSQKSMRLGISRKKMWTTIHEVKCRTQVICRTADVLFLYSWCFISIYGGLGANGGFESHGVSFVLDVYRWGLHVIWESSHIINYLKCLNICLYMFIYSNWKVDSATPFLGLVPWASGGLETYQVPLSWLYSGISIP